MSTTTPRGLSAQLRALADFVDAHPRLPLIHGTAQPKALTPMNLTAVVHDAADVLSLQVLEWRLASMVGEHFGLIAETPNGIRIYVHVDREQADALLNRPAQVPA